MDQIASIGGWQLQLQWGGSCSRLAADPTGVDLEAPFGGHLVVAVSRWTDGQLPYGPYGVI